VYIDSTCEASTSHTPAENAIHPRVSPSSKSKVATPSKTLNSISANALHMSTGYKFSPFNCIIFKLLMNRLNELSEEAKFELFGEK